MSGQQWGAAIGFVVGAFFGAPQLGAAIGGMIGGWISPTQINGPHIGDGADQSSQEGQPIPWVIGTCGWIQGNIVDKSKVREVKKTDDGKGSGTEVNTFEAHQDFQIMICESSEHRESLMVGVLIVKVDGKIVYDMRPESDFSADNAKFLKNHTFYDGNEAQLPDPTMEALPHNGIGNTPYYRGVFTMVARDINLSQYGERIPVYQFVMVGQGETVTDEIEYYAAPQYGRFANAGYPLLDPESFYTFTGLRNTGSGGTVSFSASTIQEIIDHFNTLGYNGFESNIQHYLAYSASSGTAPLTFKVSTVEEQLDVTENTSVVLVYSEELPVDWFNADATDAGESCPLLPYSFPGFPEWYGFEDGRLGRVQKGTDPPPQYPGFTNCVIYPPDPGTGNSPFIQGIHPLYIQAQSASAPPEAVSGDPCLLGVPVLLPDAPGFVIDCDGVISPEPTYVPVTGDFQALQVSATATVDGRTVYTKRTIGPILLTSDPDNTEAFWEAAYDAAVLAETMPPGLVYSVDYPKPIANVYRAEYSTTSVSTDPVGLDTVLTRIAIRGGLTADDIDVSEMDQEVLGYMVTQSYTGADSMRPLMTAFKSYGSEYDAKINFHKHGEDIGLVVDPQDIIQGTEESDQTTRDQQVEFPRTYSITYIDATQDYTARPQVDRRISSDVRAIGEIQTQVAVVLPPDYARQLANVGMKVNWARAIGSREFSLPYAGYDVYLQAVAGKPFAMDAQRRIVSEMSLQDGEIQFKGIYDRQSAYTSDISATPAIPPTPPPSNIGGVTLLALMNIGVLRDQDDRVGIYVGAAGLLAGWPGCLLQVSYDDEASWVTAIASITQSSTIGYLTAPLELAPSSGDDVTNTLSVAVHGGQLNTITRMQFLNEGNPWAIISNTATGECELGQFQTALETSTDEYDLTILARGGLNSTPAAHMAGARFCMLDSVYFCELPSTAIGQALKFRAVTFGTAPDSNPIYSLLFDPAVSQTEWQPAYLTGSYGVGSSFRLSVVPRHRLGNDLNPIASSNFTGYRWIGTDGTVTQTVDTVDPNYTFDLDAFTGTVTFSVSQLNRFTGPGPSLSIVL
jgi:hypothetical protein